MNLAVSEFSLCLIRTKQNKTKEMKETRKYSANTGIQTELYEQWISEGISVSSTLTSKKSRKVLMSPKNSSMVVFLTSKQKYSTSSLYMVVMFLCISTRTSTWSLALL